MLRFYQQYAEQLLLALIYMRDRIGNDFTEVSRYTRNNWRVFDVSRYEYQTPDVVNSVAFIHETNEMEYSLTEMVNDLQQQLRNYHDRTGPGVDGGKHDKDLIDTIVRCLQLPYARNRLSGDVLDILKKALLLPEELVGLKERMQREEMSCTQCGHKFLTGEIGSFHKERDRTQVLCTNCYHPTRFSAACGKHSIEVPHGVHKVFSKEHEKPCVYCEAEVKEKELEQPQEVILTTREVPPDDGTVVRGGRWAGRAVNTGILNNGRGPFTTAYQAYQQTATQPQRFNTEGFDVTAQANITIPPPGMIVPNPVAQPNVVTITGGGLGVNDDVYRQYQRIIQENREADVRRLTDVLDGDTEELLVERDEDHD